MRISDHQRQRAIDELGRHLSAGRLDPDEYTARVEKVALAVDLAELDGLLADLPMLRIADPEGSRRPRLPSGADPAARQPMARARLIVVAAVVVLIAGIALAVAAQWLAVAVLVGAWALGVAQGRLFSNRR